MSIFERTKLEELASIIRTTDGADRIILMQEYNTMIENWSDSFSKAKSLIDIQEAVDTTGLTADKKSSISSIIDMLLTGDATSTDEITLATKLIQAAEQYGVRDIALAGGVSANTRLKDMLTSEAMNRGWNFIAPKKILYSMDNAAMVGIRAYYECIKTPK